MSGPAIFRSLDQAAAHAQPCALAIGNFDGVHLGHQALLAKTVELALTQRLQPAVLTFHPHPTTVVAPERVPLNLCSLEERLNLLAQRGVQAITVLPFTPEVSRFSPEDFARRVLQHALQTRHVIVGGNFRFGCDQAGTPETLAALGPSLDFRNTFLPPVFLRGELVSSSSVRRHLINRRLARANRLLGRCFTISGPVVSGQGIGSRQTVPTLNLQPGPDLLVPRGVFITETFDPATGRRWQSITNNGVRPTFGGDHLTVETFLLSPFSPPAPDYITVEFRSFLRPEQAFPDAQALRSQILRDVARAQSYWRRVAKLHERIPSIY